MQFAYETQELLGQKIELLVPESIRAQHVHHREGFAKHPHNRLMGANLQLHGRRKDGALFPVEISLSHFSDADAFYVIAFIIDITERRAAEDKMHQQQNELLEKSKMISALNAELEMKVEDRTKMLRETLKELESSKDELSKALEKEKELGDLKSRFVTMASHEFRTPLSTILSSVSLLAKYTDADSQDKRDKHIQRIQDAVGNMKNILEDFLSLGKLEEGHVESRPVHMDAIFLQELTKDTISDMLQICKKGQEIKCQCDVSGKVFLDGNLFKNILVNLLSNAIKFSPEQSLIQVSLTTDAKGVLLHVADNGIGISEEDQQHLFERFFRAKNATNIQGTGLGLHIIGKYVELMHGSITLDSTLQKGTTFTIAIPNAQ